MNTFALTPHSITDRAFWKAVAQDPGLGGLRDEVERFSAEAPPAPKMPQASDYLAARRINDRGRLDGHWQGDRVVLAALAFRRCLIGLDPKDADDRLLDWLWSFLSQSTWVVSAHLPGNDLPNLGKPVLDLASCEMAAFLAEMREVMKPWMDSVSKTLADSIIVEIDRRILTPYGDGMPVGWQDGANLNNWAGVCAGSILAACISLEAQGHPRPKARERAMKGLALYIDRAFSEHGECDEGIGYWTYGLGFASIGLSRLSQDQLVAALDMKRLRTISDYPRLSHLYDDIFFAGNDASLKNHGALYFVPWLSKVCDLPWLAEWAAAYPDARFRHFSQLLRMVGLPVDTRATAKLPRPKRRADLLVDQQAAIVQLPSGKGPVLATLTGGTNAERHNHNDLGTFMLAVGNRLIIPDIGNMKYTADFFGAKRYTYLAASSRGHCCPIINGQEQRPGAQAAGQVLKWEPGEDRTLLSIDLTAAYPREAGLAKWTRSMDMRGGQTVTITFADEFVTQARGGTVTHVIWSLIKPQQRGAGQLELGEVQCELNPAPVKLAIETVIGAEHGLREFRDEIYRIEATYQTDAGGKLAVTTKLTV